MKRKINSTRKANKKNFLTENVRYALSAIYGNGWVNMKPEALQAAIKSITGK